VSASLSLGKASSFRHGIHPDDMKEMTNALAVERLPFVEEYILQLSQHTGAPSRPLVAAGMHVERGQMIAAPDGYISTALHAPVTGTVRTIELRPHPNGQRMPAIVIGIDPYHSQRFKRQGPPDEPPFDEVPRLVQEAGIVGLGGAAFPSHVKLRLPEGKKAEFVILNGCECEPHLTCDHRIMVEQPEAVVRGLRRIMQQVDAKRGYIGIEANKPDAIDALRAVINGDGHDNIEVVPLRVKYPQGAEKMLIDAIFHKEVPSGKLPLDLEIVVNNVGTAVAMTDLFEKGQPLIERVVTVTGPGIARPANLLVPLGTPLKALIDHCGGLSPETRQVIMGGPMMGLAQKRLDVPIIKGISGVLALTTPATIREEDPCIRCGRCLDACPMFLNPSRLALSARFEQIEGLLEHNVMDCFECASCSFSCPSNIPLVQLIRVGKAMVRKDKGGK
jgi:electron transport complex protein RnfC